MAATKFTKEDVVCFLGDSITQNGGWIRRIYEHYRREGILCKIFNSGVGGDTAEHAIWRLEETVFCYNPTHVVVAFGMNDCSYTVFKNEPLTEKWVIYRRRRQDNCIHYLRLITKSCLDRGIAVTLCAPTITDELTDLDHSAVYGAAAELQEIGLRIRALSEEMGVGCVDITHPFFRMQLQLWKQDRTMVGADRVHPVPEGHEFMAKAFLQEQGFPVELPETWEELETLAAQPHDPWEEKRYELELAANANNFVDWNFGYGKRSREAMDAAIRQALQTEEREWLRQRLETYAAIRDEIPARRQALIQHTFTV